MGGSGRQVGLLQWERQRGRQRGSQILRDGSITAMQTHPEIHRGRRILPSTKELKGGTERKDIGSKRNSKLVFAAGLPDPQIHVLSSPPFMVLGGPSRTEWRGLRGDC